MRNKINIMTGMGDEGSKGMAELQDSGVYTIEQTRKRELFSECLRR